MVLGTALFGKPPFKNCLCHGNVLDETGKKLSKRHRNYPDPKEIFDSYGADALRWFMVSSPIMRGQELHIDREGNFIRDVIRLHIKPIWSAYNFFTLYANADEIEAVRGQSSSNILDRYILIKCKNAVLNIKTALDNYDTPTAYKEISDFFEVLNNWYIRRNRERFWSSEKNEDKQNAYNTLYTVLVTMCEASASLIPLVTEEIYQGLTGEKSVHLTDYPDMSNISDDKILISQMDKIRDICNSALSIRNKTNVRIRQPLAKLQIYGSADLDFADIIKSELNVKDVEFIEDFSSVAERKLQINFHVVGKRIPDKIKQIIPLSKKGEWILEGDKIKIGDEILEVGEYNILLEPKKEYANCSAPLSTNDALIVLDINITPELEREGIARDIVRLIQQARKDADLVITDNIKLDIMVDSENIHQAINEYNQYIKDQTLTAELTIGQGGDYKHTAEGTIAGSELKICFEVV